MDLGQMRSGGNLLREVDTKQRPECQERATATEITEKQISGGCKGSISGGIGECEDF